jgi:PAS domain S-box-containing protein
MFGHPHEEVIGASLDLIIPEKLRRRHWEGYQRVMATRETQYAGRTLAVRGVRADGTRISVEFTVTLLAGEGKRPSGIAAILRDVTARWERQRSLQRRIEELERELQELQVKR